ncbi:MAG: hypothetical protein HQL20_07660 [Candidatus Omnitrophica bacterium]|nr:hypothetical protein [Candidatus Omnitrophota bacterium]
MIKMVVNIIVFLVVAGALAQGMRKAGEWRELNSKIVVLGEQIQDLERNERSLSGLKEAPPSDLERAYSSFVDDINSIARSYGLGVLIEGGNPLFQASALKGLREARIRVVLSRIPSRGALISLLAVLDARARSVPFLAGSMVQEKDALTMEAVIFGL